MKRTWSPDELAARWTLTDAERQPLPGRVDQNRLRFAAHLTCFAHEARFPESPRDIPATALNALSTQRHIPSTALARCDGRGRTRKHHRAQIRAWFGFRPFTATDGDALQAWLHQDAYHRPRLSNRSRTRDMTNTAIIIWSHLPPQSQPGLHARDPSDLTDGRGGDGHHCAGVAGGIRCTLVVY